MDNPTWGMPGSQLHRLVSSVYRYSGIPATQAGQLSIQVQQDTCYTGWLAQYKGIVEYQLHRLVSSLYRYSWIPATQAGQLSIQVQLDTSYTGRLVYRYSRIPATQAGQLSIQVQWDASYTSWLAQYTDIVRNQLHSWSAWYTGILGYHYQLHTYWSAQYKGIVEYTGKGIVRKGTANPIPNDP